MTGIKSPQNINQLLRIIPLRIREKLISAIGADNQEVQEFVLRTERPVCVYKRGEQYFLTENACLTKVADSQPLVTVTVREMTECFNLACGYSVYSHINEIKEGFVTVNGGHRVGICGTAVVSSGEIINIRDISTISLRVARQIIGCSKPIAEDLVKDHKGLLICGTPCSGKTTVLRDIARLLSAQYHKRVSVIDTRSELAAVCKGVNQMDLSMCDVLDSFPRCDGITQAIRTLSPEYIICDEIGTFDDAKAISSGVNSGVVFVSTMHAGSVSELKTRAYIREILSTGAFDRIVFLGGRDRPGQVVSCIKSEELL